jgi:DNA-binding transcriptional ArsR family regulator
VKVLEDARLVRRRWQGRRALVSLRPRTLAAANAWIERYRGFWEHRLDALDEYLRKQSRTKTATKEKKR